MPKTVSNLIGQLEEILKKLEYEFEDHGASCDEGLGMLCDSIDTISEVNDELDTDMEEE